MLFFYEIHKLLFCLFNMFRFLMMLFYEIHSLFLWSFNLFRFLMLLFYEVHKFFFWLFENLIRFIKLGLEVGLKELFRRWMFRGDIKNLILNVLWWELSQFIMLSFLEIYQLFFILQNFGQIDKSWPGIFSQTEL